MTCYTFIQLDLNNFLLHRSYCLNCFGYAFGLTTRCTLLLSLTLHFPYMTRTPSSAANVLDVYFDSATVVLHITYRLFNQLG